MKKLLGLLAVAPLAITSCMVEEANLTDKDILVEDIKEEVLGEQTFDTVTSDLNLPLLAEFSGETVVIDWTSSDESIIRETGEVIRPKNGEEDAVVTMTIDWTLNDVDYDTAIDVTVLAFDESHTTINFISAFDDHLHSQVVTWEERVEGSTPKLFDIVEAGSIDDTLTKDIIIVDNQLDRLFGFGLDHDVNAYWELSTDGSDYVKLDSINKQNIVLEDEAEHNLRINSDEIGTMDIDVFGLNLETGYSDVKMHDEPIEIAPHKSIYGQATPDYVSYGNETLFEMMYRESDVLRASCNAEGYGADHDFDCLFNHPGLGASLRGIAGVGSDWYKSFLHFSYNGSSAGVGMGTMRATPGDVWTITWTPLNCSAGWNCGGPGDLATSTAQWEEDTRLYEEGWAEYINSN